MLMVANWMGLTRSGGRTSRTLGASGGCSGVFGSVSSRGLGRVYWRHGPFAFSLRLFGLPGLLCLLGFLHFISFLCNNLCFHKCVAQQATGGDAPLIKSGDAFGSMFWSHEGWGG